MIFPEKLKSLRKQAGLSQEQLAEKLNVSRQAITKWETGAGIPDVENIKSIALLFQLSIDELLVFGGERKTSEFLYESVTEYDVDAPKLFDVKLGGCRSVTVRGYEGEKLRVRLVSNTLEHIGTDLKLKIDDRKKRLDVDLVRKNDLSESETKSSLGVFVYLPTKYISRAEFAAMAEEIALENLTIDIELDVKTERLTLDGVNGTTEVNCNLDLQIHCKTLCGALEINQLSSTSRLTLPHGTPFSAAVKGIGNSIRYEKNGRSIPPFDTENAENYIELNGMKSELIICEE